MEELMFPLAIFIFLLGISISEEFTEISNKMDEDIEETKRLNKLLSELKGQTNTAIEIIRDKDEDFKNKTL